MCTIEKNATMSSPRSDVFCDFFRITTAKDDLEAVLASIAPILQDMGCLGQDGAYKLPDSAGYFTWKIRHKVAVYQFTGQMASALRACGALSILLAEFASFPHRVTSADFTCDEFVVAPERLSSIYQLAINGEVSFTRKAVSRGSVRRLLEPVRYVHPGPVFDTGTVYIGRLGVNEVCAKVYDKRQERLARCGVDIPPTLRHEMTISSKFGITLRDIATPKACFYHFYPSNLLSTLETESWHGMAEGYSLPPSVAILPSQRLKQRVEVSFDLRGMFDLCDAIGEGGLPLMLRYIETSFKQRQSVLTA